MIYANRAFQRGPGAGIRTRMGTDECGWARVKERTHDPGLRRGRRARRGGEEGNDGDPRPSSGGDGGGRDLLSKSTLPRQIAGRK